MHSIYIYIIYSYERRRKFLVIQKDIIKLARKQNMFIFRQRIFLGHILKPWA